jgi:aspartate-semialdehyde dehydrogenase
MERGKVSVAVLGATGLVGQQLVKTLDEQGYNLDQLLLAASERSVGQSLTINEHNFTVQSIDSVLQAKPDVVLCAAGGAVAQGWATAFQNAGIPFIDNSSAFRMHSGVPLIIPEINGNTLDSSHLLIANPNCSTIQLVLALYPLHQTYGIKRVNVSTYQSVTGSGQRAVEQLEQERRGESPREMAYPWPIDLNCLPQCDEFLSDGYTKEEHKVINESQKILNDQELLVTATAVRVPVMGGHAESVNVQLKQPAEYKALVELLEATPGIRVQDHPDQNHYPMPRYAQGSDMVFVGRIRADATETNAWHLWVVSDNLRKGAATNAVQILNHLADRVWT